MFCSKKYQEKYKVYVYTIINTISSKRKFNESNSVKCHMTMEKPAYGSEKDSKIKTDSLKSLEFK